MGAKLRNITEFPHATGRADVRKFGETTAHLDAHQRALEAAVEAFVTKYERMPVWDAVNHRGAHTTVDAVVEIWEED